MRNYFQLVLVAVLLCAGASVAAAQTSSTTPTGTPGPKLVFPIKELGNCDSKEACRLYCEMDTHKDACLTFAQKVGLMSKEKVTAAKKIIAKKGPGGCDSREACKLYCEDSSHQEECLTFAEEHKVISEEKAGFIKRLIKGEAPGACKSPETCRMYCEDASHREECRIFAEENNLLRKVGSSTMERVKEVLASTTPGRERGQELRAIKQGSSTPPGQINKESQRKLSSTTPQNLKERPATTTPMPKPPSPPNSPMKVPAAPMPEKENLGGSVWFGFLKLLGF